MAISTWCMMPPIIDLLLAALTCTCTRRGGEGLLTEGGWRWSKWSRLLPLQWSLHLGTAVEAGLIPADIQEGRVEDVH